MSKDYKTSFITYGSIISISHVADDNSFIYCDGFVKESVILRNHVSKINLIKIEIKFQEQILL